MLPHDDVDHNHKVVLALASLNVWKLSGDVASSTGLVCAYLD